MSNTIVEMIQSQIIPSISSTEGLEEAIRGKSDVVFLLTGDILTLKSLVQQLKDANKYVFIHMDFIEGIANDRSGIQYIAQKVKPTGIITTKGHIIRTAKENGLLTIQRIFLLDGTAVSKGIEMVGLYQPDAVEVLPGLMPRVIFEITEKINLPVIVGGLIKTEEEILAALRAGALAVSLGKRNLWNLDY